MWLNILGKVYVALRYCFGFTRWFNTCSRWYNMNCFQLIKSVLDEIYIEIPGEDDEKDQEITKALEHLRAEYKSLKYGVDINYNEPPIAFAYIFKYVTTHANIVSDIISRTRGLKELFLNDRVAVVAIAGGPGSDLLGILDFLEESEYDPHVVCTTLDKEAKWGDIWYGFDKKLKGLKRLTTIFGDIDICDESSIHKHNKCLKDADLFTIVYFVSEVYKNKDKLINYLKHVFDVAKKEAYFIFVDNHDSGFYKIFDDLADKYGFEIIGKKEGIYKLTPWEDKSDLGEYFGKFGYPKLKANIAFRVIKKN